LLVKFSPYLIAMLIGLMIGVERERRNAHGHKTMGVRSFLLFSLSGALAGNITQPLIAFALAAFAVLASLLSYWQVLRIRNTQSLSMATEIAAVVTFALGYFANFEPILSLALSVIMLLFLHNETTLHSFIQKHLYPEEIQAAAILLLLTVGVIPILPDKTIDPWSLLNPRTLAIIIALIAYIQFGSYLISRIFGERLGVPLSGFLAGLVSSTAVCMTYPHMVKTAPKNTKALCASAIFATAASFIQIPVLVAVISVKLMTAILIPVIIITAICMIIGLVIYLKQTRTNLSHTYKNPLNIPSAIKLGSLIASFIIIIDLVNKFLGDISTQIATFLGALFDLHSVEIAIANLVEQKAVNLSFASYLVFLTMVSSLLPKIFLTIFLADGQYKKLMLPTLIVLLVLCLLLLPISFFWPNILYLI
jgi:uncharacterized membrane protein (DUF4010 family)